MFRRGGLIALVVAGLAVAVAGQGQRQGVPVGQRQGQPPPPPTQPAQFKSSVDIVHLDVSVLDRDRRPVRGLKPDDFTILENGQRQQIAVFTAVDIPDPPATSAPWVRSVAPDVLTNAGVEERRLFLIVIDDAAIQADLGAMNNVKKVGRQVIDRLGPSDLAGVIFTRDNRNSQDFTADHARLLTAVNKYTVGFRDMGGAGIAGADDLYFGYSVGVLRSAVEMFSALPDRRKSIIYLGQGLPVDLAAVAGPAAPGLPENGGASAIAVQGSMGRLMTEMSRLFQYATRANVNVYTVDVCGLRVEGPRTCMPGLEVDYLLTLAANTGARAVINTNDFEPGITEIFEENASYYLLGYQPVDPRQDGKFRRLEVRVNRPGLQIRTRSGYDGAKPDNAKRQAALAASPLGAALSGILPKSDLPLQLSAVPFAIAGKKEVAVAIVAGVRQPIREMAMRNVEKVDLQVSAFNVEGKPFGSARMRADVAIRAGASGLAEYEVLSRLDLKPGRYQLRIAANVGSLATSGSLYYDVDVPDFSTAPVSLSGLVVSASPGPIVASNGALAGVLPVVPTTRRVFTRGDTAAAFVRVYQGGKGPLSVVPLRVLLRNQDDLVIIDRRQDLTADRFTAPRSADVRVELPVGRLPAGAYLLTIEAGAGKTIARRDMRFNID